MNNQTTLTNFTTEELLDELKNRTDLAEQEIITNLAAEIDQQRKLIKAAYTTLNIYQRILTEISPHSDKETT
jgi:glucose-6-phosphate-specific signal transduction histidine kinase